MFPLRQDEARLDLLGVKDASLRRRYPDAEYREPRVKRGLIVRGTGGGTWPK